MSSKPLFTSAYSTAPEESFSPPPPPTSPYPPYLPIAGGSTNHFLDIDNSSSSRKRPLRQRSKSESDIQMGDLLSQQIHPQPPPLPPQAQAQPQSQHFLNLVDQLHAPAPNPYYQSPAAPYSGPPPTQSPWSMPGGNYYGQPSLLPIQEGRDSHLRYPLHHTYPASSAGALPSYYNPPTTSAAGPPVLQFAPPRPAGPPPTPSYYPPGSVDSLSAPDNNNNTNNNNTRRVKPRGQGHRQATRSEDFTTRPTASLSNTQNALFTSTADGFLAPPDHHASPGISANSRSRKRSSSTGGLGAIGYAASLGMLDPLSPPVIPDLLYQQSTSSYSASPTPPPPSMLLQHQHSQPEFASLIRSYSSSSAAAPRAQAPMAVRSSNRLVGRAEEKPKRGERAVSSSYAGSSDDGGGGGGGKAQSKTTRATIEAAQRRRAPGSEARFAW